MLIECIIKRDGPTSISYKDAIYTFDVRPELTGGDGKAKVCEVAADHAQRHFLSMDSCREYKSKAKQTPSLSIEIMQEKDLHVPTIKGLILKSTDWGLMQTILDNEMATGKPRDWVVEYLKKRIGEVKPKEA